MPIGLYKYFNMTIKKKLSQKLKDKLPSTSKPIKFKPVPHNILLNSLKSSIISNEEAYNYLTKGNDIISLKKKMKIQLRFNTPYPERSIYKWRLLKDGVEIALVDDVQFDVPTYTTEDELTIDGKLIKKWHITCQATQVTIMIDERNDSLIAKIK